MPSEFNDPQLAADIQESVAKKLAEIKGFTEEQPVSFQAQSFEAQPEEPKSGGNTVAIVSLLALLMFLISGGAIFYMWKKNHDHPQTTMREGMTPDEMKNALRPFVDNTNKRLDVLEKRADAADKRMDVISHRQWALSIAFNNNASIQEYTLRNTNPDMAGKVTWLDPDWKLSKEPAFIQLSDEDRKKLMEGIK
jgi:uncharacterized protein HemX